MKRKKFLKRGAVICLTCTTLFSSGAVYAAETQTASKEIVSQNDTEKSEITFRNLSWYSSKKDVDAALIAEGATAKEDSWQTDSAYRLSALNYPNVNSGKDRVDGGGYKMSYSNLTVAGYTPSEVHACFLYPLDEAATIIRDSESAQLYLGWYTFSGDDYTDYDSMYNDLAAKLEKLYGTATDDETDYLIKKTWHDSSNNTIQLLIDTKKTYITLGYMAADSDTRLDAMQDAITAEQTAAEAAEREKNAANTDGL